MLIVVVLLGILVAATVRLFVWPATSPPTRADVVVVFGARNSERLPEAIRLLEAGFASVLVVMTPPEDRAICRDRVRDVICLEPNPFTTRGEARAFAALAAERRWRSALLVTSRHHVTRARLLLERCFDGVVHVTPTDPRQGFGRRLERIGHEWAALIDALAFARGC